MLNCKDATEISSASLDSTLPLRRRMGLKLHLLMCQSCERFSRQIARLRMILRSFPVEEGGPLDDAEGPCLCQASRERMEEAIRCEMKNCSCRDRD